MGSGASAPGSWLAPRGHARALLRLAGVAAVTAAFFPPALLTRLASRLGARRLGMRAAARVQGLWSRSVLAVIGVRVEQSRSAPPDAHLVCANHQGYLDILVLGAFLPGRFVAMSEIAGWPVLGWLARSSGTIFLDRTRRRDLLRTAPLVEETLRSGVNVLFFPEGRSGPGDRLRPLRSPLFETAIASERPCLPVALTYRTPGVPWSTAWTVAWWGGMDLPRHVWRLLALPAIEVRVSLAESPLSGAERKELAHSVARFLQVAFPWADPGVGPPDNPWLDLRPD